MYSILLSVFFFILLLIILIKFSKILYLVDQPDNRKIHKNPTPIVGGIAIFITFYIFSYFIKVNYSLSTILISSAFILFIGILDDLFHLKPIYRIISQFIISYLFIT